MPSPNDCPEHLQAQMIIIIHPGSLNLRIGRASDFNPVQVIHGIARKRKLNGIKYQDLFLPEIIENARDSLQEFEECRLQVSHTVTSSLQGDGKRRYATPPQQISAFNRRSIPEIIEEDIKIEEPTDDILIGDEVTSITSDSKYNLHFPMRRGEFNVHPNVGGSLTAILADVQTIWEHVLKNNLKIDLGSIKNYKAVLVVSDIYNRSHLKELTSMLLTKIGFGSCFLIQDHVAATFGAGLGHACVVDVGDQKTSVSCVEDGISHPNTRVRLEYGGSDVTQTFHCLLKKCSFPFKDCNDKNISDAILLKKLKEEFCHVNLDICGAQEKKFQVYHKKKLYQYTIQVGDECTIAPLGLFSTELLSVTGKIKKAIVQRSCTNQPDSEDCYDAEYIRETGRRNAREQMEQSQADGSLLVSNDPQDEDIVVDSLEVERDIKMDKEFVLPSGQILGLDQAVLQSIERCPNDELKRKMYGCILVVGGGMKFIGIGKWLQNRVALQIPYLHRSDQLDIVMSTKDMDPAMTAWKGAAIMSCLESAPELWISQQEWDRYGLKILREKAPFMW